jgi:hypothetical protein
VDAVGSFVAEARRTPTVPPGQLARHRRIDRDEP